MTSIQKKAIAFVITFFAGFGIGMTTSPSSYANEVIENYGRLLTYWQNATKTEIEKVDSLCLKFPRSRIQEVEKECAPVHYKDEFVGIDYLP